MKQKLEEYVRGGDHYMPISNVLMNERSKNWYSEIGKYIVDKIDISKIPTLSFYDKRIKDKSIKTKFKQFFTEDYTFVGISIAFLTSTLDEEALKDMFGEPLIHSEFGEGFDRKLKKYKGFSYASYFVSVGGRELHIGYDHRGTGIEIKVDGDFNYKSRPTEKEATLLFEVIKKLIDLYSEKVLS